MEVTVARCAVAVAAPDIEVAPLVAMVVLRPEIQTLRMAISV